MNPLEWWVKRRWKAGHAAELEFWNRVLHNENGEWDKFHKNRLDSDLPIQLRICKMMSEEFPWKILDVGAGPLTSIGKTICGGSNGIEIIAVDPLAWEYDQLLAKYNIKPIVRTHMADAENLRNYVVPGELRFRDDTFDLVFCRNALDHCRDPRKALQEMIAVVKPGAYVLLEHRPDEALRTKWSGFHQWNLGMDEATVDLLLSSRWRTWNLSKSLKPLGSVHCEIIEENGEEWLITRIMKGLRTHEKTKLV